ncbi:MAG: CvpA family protein [Bacteroidales bacterium]|nr:CvpA family protein [Bacteroidales bacterium]
MNYIDILVLIPLCWFAFMGFRKGLIYELASIAALVLGAWISYRFADVVALWLPKMLLARQIAFVLIFFIVLFLVHLAGKLMSQIVKLVIPGAIDRIFGLLFGIGKVLIVYSVLFYMLEMIDTRNIIIKKETKEASLTYKYIEPIIPHVLDWKKNWDEEHSQVEQNEINNN